MRTILTIAAAAALVLPCAPAHSQSGEEVEINVAFAHKPRTVYRQALDAMEAAGFALRARILDETLLTQPRFPRQPPGADDVGVQLQAWIVPAGDSTRLVVAGRVVPAEEDGKITLSDDERGARVLEAMVMMAGGVMERLENLPVGTPTDPREAAGAYGYSRRDPVRVGGSDTGDGPARQRAYLARMRGPSGEAVTYVRLGSCCPFDAPTAPQGRGLLDAYEVVYDGIDAPVVLYFDLYSDPEPRGAPEGFELVP